MIDINNLICKRISSVRGSHKKISQFVSILGGWGVFVASVNILLNALLLQPVGRMHTKLCTCVCDSCPHIFL